jgi:hypothetical protein
MIPRKPVGCLMKSAHHIFPMRREHRGHLSNTCKPRIYMYVVSAKITRLPSKLSPTHSYYQHSHDDTSETRGVFDGERTSYFPHAPSASGAPFHTCKPRIYVYVASAKIPCLPSNLSPTQSYYQYGHNSTSECQGMPDGVYNDHFLYLEGAILVDFGRKNKNIPPQEPQK